MLAPGTALGPYKITAPIGAGGMGEVYRARDTRLGRDVAIKVIHAAVANDPDRIRRFEQEARAAGALSHENVCAVYDLGVHEGSPYVVMELLEGESLRERLKGGALPVRKGIDYAAQAARGLAAAHAKGIVHRDLKPENLFVTKAGRVKVLDFGLAKLTRPEVVAPSGEAAISIAATETGAILGTVGYMSPEQVRGEPADARSDLFALGAILYELVTGKRAFHGATYVETLNAILNEEPAPLADGKRDVPAALDGLVRRCLEKSAAERFQSASDLAYDLENLSGSGSSALRGVAVPVRKLQVLRAGLAASIAAAVLLAAGLGWLYVRQKSITPASELEFTQLTFERAGFISNGRFAPDGETILYSAAWEGRPFDVFETRPGLITSRSLGLSTGQLASLSSTGSLLVSMGWLGNLAHQSTGAQRYNLAEVPMTGGTPRMLYEGDVLTGDWHPDGRTLALIRFSGGKQRLEMPPGRILHETSKGLERPRVSPDGRFVAVLEGGELLVVDTTGRVKTGKKVPLSGHAWSPDGKELWFTTTVDLAMSELWALSLGGRERLVARFRGILGLWDVGGDGRALMYSYLARNAIRGGGSAGAGERELGWFGMSRIGAISPDGRKLLFTEGGPYGGPWGAVCVRGMDGSPPIRLGAGEARGFSPDGKWVVALQTRESPRLVLLPTGAGDSLALPRHGVETYTAATWMSDGRHIAFNGAEAGRAPRTYVQDIKGGAPRAVTPEGVQLILGRDPIGPRTPLLYRAAGQLRVRTLEADGGRIGPQMLPGEGFVGRTSDDDWIYTVRADSSIRISRLNLVTGERVPWKRIPIPDLAGWMSLGAYVTPDGSAYVYGYVRGESVNFLVEGLR